MSYNYPDFSTKSGRPLKPDAIPGAIRDYINAYGFLKEVEAEYEPGYYHYYAPGGRGRGGGRGGGGGNKNSSGNCGQHSLWWWGSDILDSISCDTPLYWKEDNELKYGTMDDLFLAYATSRYEHEFYVMAPRRRCSTHRNQFGVCKKQSKVGRNQYAQENEKRFTASTVEIVWSKVNDVICHGIKPVWRVKLRNGKSIEVTKDHCLYTTSNDECDSESYLVPKPLADLKVVNSVEHLHISEGKHIDRDFCTFLGLWMADGCYATNGVNIAAFNADTESWLQTFAKRYSRMRGTRKTRVYSNHSTGGVSLCSIVLESEVVGMFGGDADCYTKRVPAQILTSDNDSIAAFLKGYFSGDGSIHLKKKTKEQIVTCGSVNKILLDDISLLLCRLGIRHAVDSGYKAGLCWDKYESAKFYKLSIQHGLAVNRFMKLVGFIQNRDFIPRTKLQDKKGRPVSIRGIKEKEYVGEKAVYDISTMNETFIAGSGLICANTGTPPGAPSQAMGNPAPLINMSQIYNSNNLIFEKGYLYSVPAKNGVAQGQRKPVPCSTFNHNLGGRGFWEGTPSANSEISQENIEAKLAYRRLLQVSDWAQEQLTPGWFLRGGGGGGGGGGQRIIQATIGGRKTQVAIDSVSHDTKLYWKESGRLRFGTMDDLFLAYEDSIAKDEFYVVSGYRDPAAVGGLNRVKDARFFTIGSVKIGWSRIHDVVYHGIKPVWKVTLRNGRSIEVTKDHSLFTACGKSASSCSRLGAYPLAMINNVVSVDQYDDDGGERLDLELCTMAGLWMADGSYGNHCVQISTGADPDINEWLVDFSKRYSRQIGVSQPRMTKVYRKSTKGDIQMHSVILFNEIKGMFGKVDSYTKKVPHMILTADKASIAAFLKGYFSGDGWVYKKVGQSVVHCSSVSIELLKGVSVLLDRLGIRHAISEGYAGGGYDSKQLSYKLRIEYGIAVSKFMQMVGFIQKSKNVISRTRSRDKTGRPISIRRIRKVEYIGEKAVYDISTASETFVANGMLCHNTGTDAILGAGQGNKQCSFPPSTKTISIPSTSHSQGNPWFCPAWNISLAIRICLTNQYTICQDYGGGGTISYRVGGGGSQQGDALSGKEWGVSQQQESTEQQMEQTPQHQQQQRNQQQGGGGGGRQGQHQRQQQQQGGYYSDYFGYYSI